MKYVQQLRRKWVARLVVPEDFRTTLGQPKLVEFGLPSGVQGRFPEWIK